MPETHEIASKSSDGRSVMPPMDLCWSPPKAPPTPMGVPIPYPNTCIGSKITNGTRTVFIQRKMVSMADDSYFDTSTGNEPATKMLDKGLISGAITGRCYFKKWLPNVKVEGKGVSRDSDPVSHNHSNPGNALVTPFSSRYEPVKDCADADQRIKKSCGNNAEAARQKQEDAC